MSVSIICHAGKAHRDDFLVVSCSLALLHMAATEHAVEFLEHGGSMPVIYRRDPTAAELASGDSIVLDCGGQCDADRNNYDHHQRGRDEAPECALSLFAREFGLERFFSSLPWWQTTIVLDAQGPMAAAKQLGLAKWPEELASPVEGALLEIFRQLTEIQPDHWLYQAMMAIGTQLIASARERQAKLEELKASAETVVYAGTTILYWQNPTEALSLHATARAAFFPEATMAMFRSNREPFGWTIYRDDDAPAIDLAVLAGRKGISFAHKVGFIASTEGGVTIQEALCLATLAIK